MSKRSLEEPVRLPKGKWTLTSDPLPHFPLTLQSTVVYLLLLLFHGHSSCQITNSFILPNQRLLKKYSASSSYSNSPQHSIYLTSNSKKHFALLVSTSTFSCSYLWPYCQHLLWWLLSYLTSKTQGDSGDSQVLLLACSQIFMQPESFLGFKHHHCVDDSHTGIF